MILLKLDVTLVQWKGRSDVEESGTLWGQRRMTGILGWGLWMFRESPLESQHRYYHRLSMEAMSFSTILITRKRMGGHTRLTGREYVS